ncbi:MAG: hypothetical protein ACQUHE_06085 [Bacteroidia bacterium]
MKDLKTKKFWFLVLTVCICISFSGFTVLSQLAEPTKVCTENVSYPTTETGEKSSEPNNFFYIQELCINLPIVHKDGGPRESRDLEFKLPSYSPAPNTPPPDVS